MAEDTSGQAFRDEVRRARAGDRGALERLIARVQLRLSKQAGHRLGDKLRGRTRASDVLQDALLEVVRRIGTFHGETEESFYCWVTAILESSARQQSRHLNARRRRAPTRTSQLNALARAILRTPPSPLTELEQAEAVRVIHGALGALRDDYRLAIEQIVLKERPVADVADDLGRSEAATRMLLSRARAALLQEIERRERSERAS